VTYQANVGYDLYKNGVKVGSLDAAWAHAGVQNNSNPVYLSSFKGLVDSVHIYPVKLTDAEVQWDRDGTINTRRATADDIDQNKIVPPPAPIIHNVPAITPAAPPTASDRAVPMIAKYEFDGNMTDSINGGGYNGVISASDSYVDSFTLNGVGRGKALDAGNGGDTIVGGANAALTNALGDKYTITAWVARNKADSNGSDTLFSKRWPGNNWDPEPFSMVLYATVNKMNIATPGGWPPDLWVGDNMLNNTDWAHIAVSFSKSEGMDVYKNGGLMAHWGPETFGGGVSNNANAIYLSQFHGLTDSLHIYAAKLSAAEVAWDRDGTIKTKTAVASDLTDSVVIQPPTPVPHAEPAFAITAPPADAPAVPIVADYEFEDNMLDTSGHGYDGTIGPYDLYADAFAYGGHDSRALWVTNADPKRLSTLGGSAAIQLNQLSDQYTVTAWIARDTTNTNCFLFAKRTADQSWMPSEPFLLRTWSGGDSQLNIMKGGWLTPNVGIIGLNTTAWTHYALTYRANQGLYIYINGAEKYHLGADVIDQGVVNNSNPIILSDFKGLIDSMRVYAVALTPEQVGWEMSGTLGTRPADAGDINKDPLPSPPVPPAAPPANPGGVWPGVPVNTAPEPIIASFNFDNNIQDQVSGLDNGKKSPAHSYSQGYFGQGLLMDGKPNVDMTILPTSDMLRRICGDFTVSMWIYPDKLSSDQMLLSKRWENNWQSTPLQLYLFNNGSVRYNGYYGTWYEVTTAAGAVSARKWTHIAVSFNNGEKARWYVNGVEVMSQDVPFDLAPNENEFSLLNFKGTLDELKFYSAVLTGDEVKLDMDGRLATRPAVWDDIPPVRKYVDAKLVRVDMPIGKTDMNNSHLRYYNQAERNLSGPNAVDWPEMTITIPDAEGVPATQPLFRNGSAEIFQIMMEMGDKRYDYFQLPTDSAIEPGNHWMRGISWLWGQCYIYSTDNSARSWMTDYELWTFPVIIKGAGKVTDVTLKYDGKAIYNKTGLSYDSLTLLLPASAKNKSYSISVNGGAEQSFEAGWKPIEGGNPVNERTDINLVTDTGFTVQNLKNPEKFSNQAEWDADKAALSIGGPARPAAPVKAALPSEHLGLDVPRSGVTTYAAALAAGMDGGFYIDNSPNAVRTSAYSNIGTPATYARHISDLGIDLVYEQSKSGDGGQTFAGTVMDSLARALGEKNIKIGVVPDAEFGRPFLQHPNLSLFSYSLPEYHAPLYRETALTAQRLLGYGNMAGVNVGADNSAYEAYWSWAPVIPNRPFGEALSNLYNSDRPEMLISPTLRGTWYGPMDYETYAGSVADFVNYLTGFNDVFRQFGYFNNAVSSVDPSLTLISGSYGSSPGVGSSGGWAWGTIPVREMYENVSVMQAYDWNELNSSKPLHNVSLIDRMRSYYPNKAAWSILDDYLLHFEKMQREAEWAMALTRGLNGIGTNTVPNDVGDYAAPDKIAALKNVTDWAHRYGGTFAMTEPDASVGVMFVFEQALLKPVLHGVNGPFDQLYNASHEGKTNEAMVMLQAAGWPAKIITPEELRRGLPDGMKAILLVGLGGTDGSWHWYDGIEDELKAFADNGGIFVADDMSIVPAGVTAVKPGISMASYIGQSDKDETGTLINRNAANIEAFCGAMSAAGAEAPLAVTGQKDAWAVPSRAGNTEYLTVVNEKHDNNANEVTGRTVGLTWNAAKVSGKTVYDVRTGQRLETLPATADLTAHGFQ
ncbi:MAG: LamG domain-containing protein, partial [Firmicutes bacterium]|nr:LamG domain-containing protein [Bacillota bacterium]